MGSSSRGGDTPLPLPKLQAPPVPVGKAWTPDDGWNPDGSWRADAPVLGLLYGSSKGKQGELA